MKRSLTTSLFLFTLMLWSIEKMYGQAWQWAASAGELSDDFGYSVAVDPDGNVYTTGKFMGTADFDPGPGIFNLISTSYYGHMFISKLDSSGNFVWAISFNGSSESSSTGRSITVDPAGNVYTTGYFWGTIDFDPGPNTNNISGGGMFISKLNSAGTFLWAKSMGGDGYAIATDLNGNVYTTGTFYGTMDFDPGAGVFDLSSAGEADIFISKLDISGNFVWAKAIGGIYGDHSNAVTVDESGNVYTTGSFGGNVDFDPGSGIYYLSAGYLGIFISKLDASGNFVWAKSMFGSETYDFSRAYSIVVDHANNIYTTGWFTGTIDFDPGIGLFNLTASGASDIFISKLDGAGNLVWAKSIGGLYDDHGYSLDVDTSGNVYTTGSFRYSADFDPGEGTYYLESAGVFNIFVSKLDNLGNFVWAQVAGGTEYDIGRSLAVSASGDLHITGNFQSPSFSLGSLTVTNADPGTWVSDPESIGLYFVTTSDIFMAKLDGNAPPCTSVVTNSSDSEYGSLRQVISCAPSGSSITFNGSLLDQTIILTTGEIEINKNLTISGLGMMDLSISGNNSSRIFHLLPGKNLNIENLSLINATALMNGGAILIEGNLSLKNVRLENNYQNGIPKSVTMSPGGFLTISENVDIQN